ncbi:MAG: S41 family peptidase [Candidatus Eremiobacterota bacterium]
MKRALLALCLVALLSLTSLAQGSGTLLVLVTIRQVRHILLRDALAAPTPEMLTRAAWSGAGLASPGADWQEFERAFSRLSPRDAVTAGEGALRSMVDSLQDPYSTLVTPAERAQEDAVQRSGTYSGIGVELAWRKGLVVVGCLDGSPALKAGLRPGDRLLEIDGNRLDGLTYYAAGNLLLGPRGSPCRLLVGRDGGTQRIELTRQAIQLPPVKGRLLAPGVGLVRVGFFQPDTARQVRHELSLLEREGAGRIILDLRQNPGGDFEAGLKTAGLFASGPLLLLEERGGKRKTLTNRSARFWKGPVVLLVDSGSASASEIVAQALQGRPQVTVLGQRTFGKARVQTFYSLPGGGGLHLTTARYLSLEGQDLNGVGLQPDVVVPAGQDPIQQALDQLSFIPVR